MTGEKYILDGKTERMVRIINESGLGSEELKVLRAMILVICRTNQIAKRFPELFFYIKQLKNKDLLGGVNLDKIKDGKMALYLNANAFSRYASLSILRKELTGTIIHELAHLWHEYVSGVLVKREKDYQKLLQVLKEKFSSKSEAERDLRYIREWLLVFFQNLLIEGLAIFCEEYSIGNVEFTKRMFQTYYFEADGGSKAILKLWKDYITNPYPSKQKALTFTFGKFAYDLGFHMVYSLIALEYGLDLKKIAKLSPHKFAKKYEKVIKNKGLKPVVSLTSGDGILDYKRMVAEWWAVAKKS